MQTVRHGRRAASTRRVRPRTHLCFMLVLLVGALTAVLPSDASANGLSYVAMGDSYPAGPGILPYSTTAPPGCGQSQANYPHLVASVLGLSLTDVSCGGAKTENLENEQVLASPPNNPPARANRGRSYAVRAREERAGGRADRGGVSAPARRCRPRRAASLGSAGL